MYDYKEILIAAERLKGVIQETPLFESSELNEKTKGKVLIKPECLQRTGSFKLRGAYNLMCQLSDADASRGVVAFSSGNHAQGVALAGNLLGIKTTIVIPEDAPKAKIENTKKLGGNVILYNRYKEDREEIAKKIALESNSTLVPSYDHKDIIIGQGTVGLEIIQQCKEMNVTLDQVIICCGGGGLSAGSSLAIKGFLPEAAIYLVEPRYFNDTQESFNARRRIKNETDKKSICDALLAEMPGELTFSINKELASDVLTVSDAEVKDAMRFAFLYLKMVVEPGGAVALAATLHKKIELEGRVTAIVLSGGNVDRELFDAIQSSG
ncbi:threonine/serine dehydratase [Woeseiaceae bacterium]|jgi:threonine dehydratase|nr:threonine/serine dehydratase [Woeseiaceae bacterium]